MRRMIQQQEHAFHDPTAINDNYHHPALPEGVEEGIVKGMYKLQSVEGSTANRVNLMGAGVILREVIAAADMLSEEYGIGSVVWSVTSFTELRKDGLDATRWNNLNPSEPAKVPYVTSLLNDYPYPAIASSDYMKAISDGLREFIPTSFKALGTDGFGRSDTREKLRDFFEIDRRYIVITALNSLVEQGTIDVSVVTDAVQKYGIDPNKPNPVTV